MKVFERALILSSLWLTSLPAKSAQTDLSELPKHFDAADEAAETFSVQVTGAKPRTTNIVPYIQYHLDKFLVDRGNPVAATVLVDVATGKILAMSQGRAPNAWGAQTHTALHQHFPAASVFKTVVAAAAFELADIGGDWSLGLNGGCGTVRPTGVWLEDNARLNRRMSLRNAFGKSCNGFFANLALNFLGLNALLDYARRFGWEAPVESDFKTAASPLNAPNPRNSSVHAIGRYAAGFGPVGMSAVHAAWMYRALAQEGVAKKIYLFDETYRKEQAEHTTPSASGLIPIEPKQIVLAKEATDQLKEIMHDTVLRGTASFAFKRGKYRPLREVVGGKTGTLTGQSPAGVTTWFVGMMPLEKPEVVVASVVVLEDLWHIKGPNLAAETLWLYESWKNRRAKSAALTGRDEGLSVH